MGEVARVNAPVLAGASYTTAAKFQLPAGANGSWFLLAVVDKSGDINEQSETNNTFAVPLTIGRADFVVDAFTGPATAANGERVALSWTVRNAGTHLAHGKLYTSGTDSYRWHDRVYLSVDATWDAADTFVGEVARVNAPLAAGATYTTNATMQLPKVYAEGATHLIVVADKLGDVSELREDDNAFVIPLTVLRSDLVAESFTAPAEAAPGELISLSWTARNIGNGTAHGALYTSGTDSYRWYDKVYLSVDASLDSGDIYVGEVSRTNAPLVAGAGYTVSPTMQVPVVASGPWYLIAAVDRNGDINEQSEAQQHLRRAHHHWPCGPDGGVPHRSGGGGQRRARDPELDGPQRGHQHRQWQAVHQRHGQLPLVRSGLRVHRRGLGPHGHLYR